MECDASIESYLNLCRSLYKDTKKKKIVVMNRNEAHKLLGSIFDPFLTGSELPTVRIGCD